MSGIVTPCPGVHGTADQTTASAVSCSSKSAASPPPISSLAQAEVSQDEQHDHNDSDDIENVHVAPPTCDAKAPYAQGGARASESHQSLTQLRCHAVVMEPFADDGADHRIPSFAVGRSGTRAVPHDRSADKRAWTWWCPACTDNAKVHVGTTMWGTSHEGDGHRCRRSHASGGYGRR